jgi:DNA modification methylase
MSSDSPCPKGAYKEISRKDSMEPNSIYCGDCLDVLKRFPDNSVDLIYLDPPFFSNRHYEVIWKDGAEIRAFGDRWKGGINHYVGWMEERIRQCHRVLKDTGSIYVHCDWHAVHYLKVMMDKVFVGGGFNNEIIWVYSRATSPKQKVWGRMHDNILFYSKSHNWTFNVDDVRLPYSESSKSREGYTKMFHNEGDLKGGKCKLNPLGKFPEDWWNIPIIRPNAEERLGYPTQKPLELLERIIKASSNKGDIVLDPFCGCGTTLVAAQKLGRRWIGIDISRTACKLMSKRLHSIGVSPHIITGDLTEEELLKYPPFEFQNWVCEKLGGRISPKKSGDMGIDGWTLDMLPIQVKQSRDVGRNPIDNFQTAIRRAKRKKGIFVALSFGKGAYEEAARAKNDGIEIKLITVKELLEGKGGVNG